MQLWNSSALSIADGSVLTDLEETNNQLNIIFLYFILLRNPLADTKFF